VLQYKICKLLHIFCRQVKVGFAGEAGFRPQCGLTMQIVLTAQAAFLRGTSMPVASQTAAHLRRWAVKDEKV
jgi:hypothetical protein